jgi:plasmid stabilization system protein ParE
MLKVILTEKAEKSLEEITDFYLAEYSQERTLKVVDSIEDAFEKIATYPNHFPLCFDIKMPSENIRQMILHNTFKIIYRIKNDRIEILEIFHGSRNNNLLKNLYE